MQCNSIHAKLRFEKYPNPCQEKVLLNLFINMLLCCRIIYLISYPSRNIYIYIYIYIYSVFYIFIYFEWFVISIYFVILGRDKFCLSWNGDIYKLRRKWKCVWYYNPCKNYSERTVGYDDGMMMLSKGRKLPFLLHANKMKKKIMKRRPMMMMMMVVRVKSFFRHQNCTLPITPHLSCASEVPNTSLDSNLYWM